MSTQRSRRGALIGGVLGAAAAGVAAGLAVEKHAIGRTRLKPDPEARENFGELPGRASTVTTDDGLTLHVEETGSGPLTVVFIHGYALSMHCWHYQRRDLEDVGRLVFYDQRSHGQSQRSLPDNTTVDQLGRDLAAVLDQVVPTGPVVLVGHSMGGMTIMALAELYPELVKERVAGVAFLATSAGEVGSSGLSGTWLSRRNPLTRGVGLLAAFQPSLVEGVRKAAGDVVWAVTRRLAYGDRSVSPALVDLADSMISANAVDALTDFVDTIGSHDRVAALPALATCEVLVAAGDGDRVIPFSHSEVIAAELPEARLVRFDGVGHLPMLEQADAMNEALADLLRRCAARGRGSLRRLRKRA
jgi:pimeloyl-ACP methyl ester carboxylesterase